MKDDSVYLNHILEFIGNIFDDTKGMSLEDFLANRTIQDSVTRNVEILGEAVKHLSAETQSGYPEVPWSHIARTRDMLCASLF